MSSNLEAKAYSTIKQKILDYEMFPNQIVSDYLLSEELQMSRTPIKHALLKLESDGLIVRTGKSASYRVSEITTESITELFDYREAIETAAYTIACRDNTIQSAFEALHFYVDKMAECVEQENQREHFHYDQCFHHDLVACSKNQYLIAAYESISLHLIRMRFLSFLNPVLQEKANQYHKTIITSAENMDYEKGLSALKSHIQASRDDYVELFGKGLSPKSLNLLQYFVFGADSAEQKKDTN